MTKASMRTHSARAKPSCESIWIPEKKNDPKHTARITAVITMIGWRPVIRSDDASFHVIPCLLHQIMCCSWTMLSHIPSAMHMASIVTWTVRDRLPQIPLIRMSVAHRENTAPIAVVTMALNGTDRENVTIERTTSRVSRTMTAEWTNPVSMASIVSS